MKINKRSSDNRGSMKKLFFRTLYLFIGSALILFGGLFLYVRELIFIFTLIGVVFVASGFWMIYRLAYKPSDKMEISTKIAIIVIVIAWFATAYFIFPFPLLPPEAAFYLSVFEVDYEPNRYFVLDEEMEMYSLFRSVLDKMEAEGTRGELIEITREEMEKLMEKVYISSRHFKYEGNFYEFSIVV